jgi:hypothetical protein
METTENTQIEAVLEALLDQDYQAKRHMSHPISGEKPDASHMCARI